MSIVPASLLSSSDLALLGNNFPPARGRCRLRRRSDRGRFGRSTPVAACRPNLGSDKPATGRAS